MGSSVFHLTLGVILAGAVSLDVWACGGTFCAQATNQPLPVDQSAERIVFEVEGPRTCAHVQVDYEGEPEEFAWLVPVPRDVQISESNPLMFTLLDNQTAPTFRLPSSFCGASTARFVNNSSGCGDQESFAAIPDADIGSGGTAGVDVRQRSFTQNYEYAELSADRTDALIQWLQDNRFNVSDNMRPGMEPYIREGSSFLAVKLRPERGSDSIPPIQMCYEGPPSIPIRLTAVAARPHIGILVYVLSTRPYRPRNYVVVDPDTQAIMVDAATNVSYFDWVARVADESEGRIFVPEFVGTLPGPVTTPGGATYSVASRYYTRLSPEHMGQDPVFEPGTASDRRNSFIDLSLQPSPFQCPDDDEARPQPSACAFNYCGAGARCTVVEGQAACECPNGQVADEVQGPDGRARIACVPSENPLGITAEASGVGTPFDPCIDADCGAGSCVVKSGFATCRCAEGLAAVGGGTPTCIDRPQDPAFFGPGAGAESRPRLTLGQSLRGFLPQTRSLAQLGPWMFLGLYFAARRRRRSLG
ncbi:MAG: DUF2330 domain-containing protein [Myxococcota bacterium]